jgi:PAS domain S-box-containing protein
MDAPPSAEALLSAFLSHPEEAVIGFFLDGSIFLWNRAAEALYGFRAEECIGKCARCFLPPEEWPAFDRLLSEPSLAEDSLPLMRERLKKSGQRFSCDTRRTLLRSVDGQPMGILERSRDLAWEHAHPVTETHLQLLVEKLPLTFWTTDRQLRVISCWGCQTRPDATFPAHLVGECIQEFFGKGEASAAPVKQHFLALRGARPSSGPNGPGVK